MMAAFLMHRPRLLLLVIGVVTASGLSSYWVLPRLEDPVLGRRVGIVGTVFPGADAERVESLVTIPIEDRLRAIPGVRQIRSNSQTDISNVVVELEDEIVDVDAIWMRVRDRLLDLRNELPESCQTPELQVVPLKAFAAILRISPAGNGDLASIRAAARELRSNLTAIAGTESVSVFGDPGEEIVVDLDPLGLARTGLPPGAVAEHIASQTDDRPAGRLRQSSGDLAVQVRRDEPVLDRIANTVVTYGPSRNSVLLREIATVERRLVAPPGMVAMAGNRRAIVLGVLVQDDQRLDDWDVRMRERLGVFRAKYAELLDAEVLFSQAQHVSQRMTNLLRNLAFGTLAVMAVVLLMMGWRSMLVVAAALPLSALMVLSGMRYLGIPLHQMSVTGLIVALGLLIDNAIVIVDEVRTRTTRGAKPATAISGAIQHLAMPLFGSTLTTVLAFLPIATLPGAAGEFVGTIAVSVILAITASFLLAITVIPALSGLLTASSSNESVFNHGLTFPSLSRGFHSLLGLVLRRPLVGVMAGLILPVCGFVAARRLPEQFFPSSDRAQIQIEVELASRSTIASAERTAAAVRDVVAADSQVTAQHWFVGGSAPTFFYNVVPRRRGTPFYAQAFVDLESTDDLVGLVRRLQLQIDDAVPEARVLVRLLEQGPPFDAPLEIRLCGSDLPTLQRLGREIRSILQSSKFIIHTRSDLGDTVSGLRLKLDSEALFQSGLDDKEAAGFVYTMLEGVSAGSRFVEGEDLPVRVRLNLKGALKRNRLAAMPLPSVRLPGVNAAGPVPDPSALPMNRFVLGSVAEFELDSRAGAIVHVDGCRASEVKGYVAAGVLPSVALADFRKKLRDSDFVLPEGYELVFGGEKAQRTQAVSQLIANGVILFSVMLLTLVASFQSFRCAFVIATVGGLAVGLGPLALYLCGFPFGFMAIVGTMGLVGVAINDSIVVLASLRANQKLPDCERQEESTVVIASARHVLATTFTTIVGFLPLIIAGGRFWPPLAVTIAGGVGGATLLALLFVPAMHQLMFGHSRKMAQSQ